MTKNEYELIDQIISRAYDTWHGLRHDRLSDSITMEYAHKAFNLDLDAFLSADIENFYHDFFGILNNANIERISATHEPCFDNCFLPRFARCSK